MGAECVVSSFTVISDLLDEEIGNSETDFKLIDVERMTPTAIVVVRGAGASGLLWLRWVRSNRQATPTGAAALNGVRCCNHAVNQSGVSDLGVLAGSGVYVTAHLGNSTP